MSLLRVQLFPLCASRYSSTTIRTALPDNIQQKLTISDEKKSGQDRQQPLESNCEHKVTLEATKGRAEISTDNPKLPLLRQLQLMACHRNYPQIRATRIAPQ